MSRWLDCVQRKRLPPLVRLAASTGVKAPVESYLRAGRDPDATDTKNRTLLLLAAAGGSADICRLLLESGADPSRRDAEENDALSVAIRNGNMDAASVLRACIAPEPSVHRARGGADSSAIGPVEADLESANVSEEVVPGFDQWVASTEPLPPQDEPALYTDAVDVQNGISKHVPIDTDFDWSDVEIELPESATWRDEAYAFWLDEVRNLIHFGLSWGWVTVWQIADVASDSGGRDDVDEIESRLRLALGDVGILVEDDPALAPIVHLSWPVDVHAVGHGGIMDDAIAFIDNLSQTRDLHTYYRQDIQQMEAAVRRRREARR